MSETAPPKKRDSPGDKVPFDFKAAMKTLTRLLGQPCDCGGNTKACAHWARKGGCRAWLELHPTFMLLYSANKPVEKLADPEEAASRYTATLIKDWLVGGI